MRAIKLQAYEEKDHAVSLRVTEDVPEGPAEVIVLVLDPSVKPVHSHGEFLARLPRYPRRLHFKEEIKERQTWDQYH